MIRRTGAKRNSKVNSNKILTGFAGDVMIGRGVNNIISEKGYLYPWGDVLPLLKSADINVINLETTLTKSNRKVDKVFNFKATPGKIKTLQEANIAIANLANNHILDFSEEGLIETLHTLDKTSIKHVGAGMNEKEAAKPEIIVVKNISLGLIGFTDNESTWKATPTNSGTNYINIEREKDREYALSLIMKLRKEVDIVIVSIHWGYNMQEEPSVTFMNFAHAMVEHGASIIHGHSAHIFQGIEMYKNKLIMYDTGDFVDDYVVDDRLKNDHSFFFLISLSKQGIENIKLIPVLIDYCQVNIAKNGDYKWSIERMQKLSKTFGTKINDDGEVVFS
jgi:poly-gamma-glutamate capsule biosynthesis protein CapA/YwtB (metallophosphatase superfamily)